MLRKMLFTQWMLVLVAGFVLVAAGCTTTTAPPEPTTECTTDADCPEGQVCDNGECVEPAPEAECETDADCAEGETCVEGECVEPAPETECETDADCAEGETCVEGECVELVGGPCTVEGADPDAGGTAYAASCASDSCHGADASGPITLLELEDVTTSMQERFGGGEAHMGATLTNDEIRDIACWLSQQ